jgi:hypothetical protein
MPWPPLDLISAQRLSQFSQQKINCGLSYKFCPFLRTVERVFRQASRFVCDIPIFDLVSLSISEKLSWLFPKYRRDYEL